MLTALNVALLVLASASTLAAFGGDTWDKGEEPILKRIKPRGWVSLSCLVLAFALGVFREALTRRDDLLTKSHAKIAELEAKQQQTELRAQLAVTQGDLRSEKKQLETMTDDLTQAKSHVIEVQSYLASTRTSLVQQSTVNLVTAFSENKNKIAEAWLMFPLKATGPKTLNASDIVLAGVNQTKCADSDLDVKGVLEFGGGNAHYVFPNLDPGLEALERKENKMIDAPGVVIDGNQAGLFLKLVNQLVGQRSTNKYVLVFRVIPAAPVVPNPSTKYDWRVNPVAADFVANMMTSSSPFLFEVPRDRCMSSLRNVVSSTFDKAVLILVLDDPQGQALYYTLRAQSIKNSEHNKVMVLPFRTDSLPTFTGFPSQWLTNGVALMMDHPESYQQRPSK